MKIKYCEFRSEVGNFNIIGEGEFEVDNFNGYELFEEKFKQNEGEGVGSGLSEEDYKRIYEEVNMKSWLMVRNPINEKGWDFMSFMKV